MELSEPMVLFLIGQSIVIIGSVLLAYLRTQVLVAEVKAQLVALHAVVATLKADHGGLQETVAGISRHVAMIEGMELERRRQEGKPMPQNLG